MFGAQTEIVDADVRDRALGAILGACLGDTFGSLLERLGRAPTQREAQHCQALPGGGFLRVAPGQCTDDGEMTVSLFNALLEAEGNSVDVIQESMAVHYGRWAESEPFDMGITIGSSIGITLKGAHQEQFRQQQRVEGLRVMMMRAATFSIEGRSSKANGALMRCTPLGVYGRRLADADLARLARLDASLSHPNSTCVCCSAAYSIAIAALVSGSGPRQAYDRALSWALENARASAAAEVVDWLQMAAIQDRVQHEIIFWPQAGFVKVGFVLAFFFLLSELPLLQCLTLTARGGGDTDTNCAIVGGLVGASLGWNSVDDATRSKVLSCDTNTGRPRPDFVHPKLVMEGIDDLLLKSPDNLM